MSKISIAHDGRTLMRDGKPFFWLADTCWSAFTNISDEEWDEYLDLRASQGFNVLQINALPQWDRCGCGFDRYPFPTTDHGATFSFDSFDEPYFEHAREMCAKMVARDITPAIVVMWSNYVPGTWASAMCGDNVIPLDRVEAIVRKVCSSFNEFDPIYIVSGDTDLDTSETRERYALVTDVVESCSPDALLAYHIKGRYDVLPDELAAHADIYLYQSGHNIGAQGGAITLARSFCERNPRKPVINSEPCYEQMGYSHMLYGRFRREDCRRALWRSILAGASSGITYGAHGVWNWQNPDCPGTLSLGEGFLQALPHELAIRFEGADDFGRARRIVERLDLEALEPCQGALACYEDDIRAARTDTVEVVYVPTNCTLKLHGDYADASVLLVDLSTGSETPSVHVSYDAEKDLTTIPQGTYLEDALYVIRL